MGSVRKSFLLVVAITGFSLLSVHPAVAVTHQSASVSALVHTGNEPEDATLDGAIDAGFLALGALIIIAFQAASGRHSAGRHTLVAAPSSRRDLGHALSDFKRQAERVHLLERGGDALSGDVSHEYRRLIELRIEVDGILDDGHMMGGGAYDAAVRSVTDKMLARLAPGMKRTPDIGAYEALAGDLGKASAEAIREWLPGGPSVDAKPAIK
jgi:hypothetical protein